MSQLCDDQADVYREPRVRARKAHCCSACRETIEPGHFYHRVSMVWDGTARSWKRCLRCQAIHVHLREVDTDPDGWPDEALACGHSYEDVHREPPPPEIAALAFMSGADLQPQEGS